MGSTICTAGFPSAAIASSCFTARCDSIWYGFFIATLLFSAKENSLSAYQGWERGVATFYDLPGIPAEAQTKSLLEAFPEDFLHILYTWAKYDDRDQTRAYLRGCFQAGPNHAISFL